VCPAEGRFNRTTTIAFAPELVLYNQLEEPIVVWQRDTGAVPETPRTPKPEIRNPKPETLNPKP